MCLKVCVLGNLYFRVLCGIVVNLMRFWKFMVVLLFRVNGRIMLLMGWRIVWFFWFFGGLVRCLCIWLLKFWWRCRSRVSIRLCLWLVRFLNGVRILNRFLRCLIRNVFWLLSSVFEIGKEKFLIVWLGVFCLEKVEFICGYLVILLGIGICWWSWCRVIVC